MLDQQIETYQIIFGKYHQSAWWTKKGLSNKKKKFSWFLMLKNEHTHTHTDAGGHYKGTDDVKVLAVGQERLSCPQTNTSSNKCSVWGIMELLSFSLT